MVEGSCLCGSVRWRAEGELSPISHCHCSRCRKAHAAAFASFTSCSTDDFEWASGHDSLGHFNSPGGFVRSFCKTCGSSAPIELPANGRVLIPAGCFDDDPKLRGGSHIFVGSKAPWHAITDDLECHDTFPSASAPDTSKTAS